jgi:hypothetical protein
MLRFGKKKKRGDALRSVKWVWDGGGGGSVNKAAGLAVPSCLGRKGRIRTRRPGPRAVWGPRKAPLRVGLDVRALWGFSASEGRFGSGRPGWRRGPPRRKRKGEPRAATGNGRRPGAHHVSHMVAGGSRARGVSTAPARGKRCAACCLGAVGGVRDGTCSTGAQCAAAKPSAFCPLPCETDLTQNSVSLWRTRRGKQTAREAHGLM